MIEDMVGGGTGLYTLRETAKYARMSHTTLSRWLKGSSSCERVFPLEETKIITFADFMQVLAVRNLRVLYNVPLQKIREAVDRASKEYGIDYPFARKHTTYLFDRDIWIKPEGVKESDFLVQVSGKSHGQPALTPVIERFLVDVFYDEKTGLANRYKAFERNNHQIVMNPKVRFGEPILDNSGYTPGAIFEAAKTEGSVEAAARMYGLSREQVEVCIDYFDYLHAA